MPTLTNSTPAPASDTGLLGKLASLLGSAKSTLDNGIKTDVSVTFPSTVYFDIFALVVFSAVAIVLVQLAAKSLGASK